MGNLIRKNFTGTVVLKAEGDSAPRLVFRASDSTPDRAGDRVFVADMDLSDYERNPVLLWSHDHSLPAIGTAKVWKEGTGADAVLYMEPLINDATQLSRDIKASIEAGTIRSCSVGIQVKSRGSENEFGGYDLTTSSLYEISLCNVPMNPMALREMALSDEEQADVSAQLQALTAKIEELSSKVDALTAQLSPEKAEPTPEPSEDEKSEPLSPLARALKAVLEQ